MKLKLGETIKLRTIMMVFVLAVIFLGNGLMAAQKQIVEKSFAAKKRILIKTVSGDCMVEKGASDKIMVKVVHNYDPEYFEPVFKEEGDGLILEEKFKKSISGFNNASSTWTVTVPENIAIDANSASGNISIRNTKGDVAIKTASGEVSVQSAKNVSIKSASGDIQIANIWGEIGIKTASGSVNLSAMTGKCDIKTASGDIQAQALQLTGPCVFKAVSGDVKVSMAKTSDFDLIIQTTSGNISLNYNGNPIKGYFEFKGQNDEIDSDIALSNESGSNHNPFGKKYFKQGSDSPKVSCESVSGSITFKK